ncbi:MAG: rhomboid family intramembrane serine protease [Candidatus Thermoplasmatota archaeon]|nr:rhomboid family intramembrane serine protease [Candidatus Thermoplasmatota archaeon]
MSLWYQMDTPHWIGLFLLVSIAIAPFIFAFKNKTSFALATTISLLVTFLLQRIFGLIYSIFNIHMDPHNLLVTIPDIAWNPIELHRMLSATWLHSDYFHILSNVIVIALVGIPLELRLGNKRFMLVYLIGGLGGSISWVYFNAGSTVPALGASGAAFGLLGAYLACWPKDEIEFPFILIRKWPISMIALIYFGLEVGRAFTVYGMGELSSVGHIAHLGGFLVCYVFARPRARNGPTPLDIIDSGPTQGGIHSALHNQKRESMKSLESDPWTDSNSKTDVKLMNVLSNLRISGDEIETREAWMEKLVTIAQCPTCDNSLEVRNLSNGPNVQCSEETCNFSWP